MPNPIQERVLVAASYGHYSQRAARIGPGCINARSTSRIRFLLFKEGLKITVQNRPGSDLDVLVKFWQNSISPLSVSHFQTRLRSSTDGPDHIIVQTQPRSDLVLADFCEDLAKRIRFGSKPVCKNFRGPLASGQRSRADPDRMRMGSGMCTGQRPTCSFTIKADPLPIEWTSAADVSRRNTEN